MNEEPAIEGERAAAPTLRLRTSSARMYRTVGLGLLGCATLVLMGWYVAHVRASAADVPVVKGAARGTSASAQVLPPLGIERTRPATAAIGLGADGAGTEGATPAVQGRTAPPPAGVDDEPVAPAAVAGRRHRDTGPVLVRMPPPATAQPATTERQAMAPWRLPLVTPDLAGLLAAPAVPATPAPAAIRSGPIDVAVQPDRRFLLPKGSFLDCTLETAIDSTLPGLATCILATDVYGADGRVVLMERGTRLIGETRADVRPGQSRVAVLWQDARTPAGVRLELGSAGTDALGRAGVPGTVDRHLGDRFGAAILMSFIDAGASALASRRQGSGTVLYNPQASRDIATEALRDTIGIPPTIRVDPGARIQVIVASDVSFRNVYRLVAHDPG